MGARREGQRVEVISPLKRGDNAPLADFLCQRTDSFGCPKKILLVKAQLRKRVVAMRVEARRNQDQFGIELLQRGQQLVFKRIAELNAA